MNVMSPEMAVGHYNLLPHMCTYVYATICAMCDVRRAELNDGWNGRECGDEEKL